MTGIDLSSAASLTMSTREVASLTGKLHRNVVRDARKMLTKLHGEGGLLKFEHSYLNEQGKLQPEYRLPKRETLILVSGYSVEMRARIIDRWLELEAAVAQPDFLRIADQARVDMETTRDLVASEAKHTRGAIIKSLQDLVANPIAALKAYLNDRFVALHERDTRLIHDVEHLKRRQEAMAAEQHQVLDLARVAVAPTTIVAADWVNAKGIFALLNVPHSRALSAKVVRSVAAYAIEVDRQGDVRSVPYDRSQLLYRAALVRSWFKDRGRRLIEEHLAKHSNVVNLQARLV